MVAAGGGGDKTGWRHDLRPGVYHDRMRRRPFGATGWQVGEVGLGCWQLGGSWGDPPDPDAARAILRAAVDHGVDFLDTADVYGGGRSETLIGDFLNGLADGGASVRVATKLGRKEGYPDGYSLDLFRRCTEASLKRLGRDRLDLTQLHCVPTAVLRRGEVFDWLRALKDQGLIRQFGASVESVEEAVLCLRQDGLASLQVIFNVLRQKPAEALFEQAKAAGVAVIVRLPLASGLLTGKLDASHTFAENDHRHSNRDGQQFNVGETFAGLPFVKGVALTEDLEPLVPAGVSMAQWALRWVLDHDAVSVVIPGASRPEQAAANAGASDLPPLGADVHEQLRGWYRHKVAAFIRGPY